MRMLLIQLSDIHVRSGDDIILGRSEIIAAAVQNLDYQLDAAVLAVSGDLAFAGAAEQYEAVWGFLYDLAAQLSAKLSSSQQGVAVPVSILAIPGNHDCDFSDPGAVRSLVIEGILTMPERTKDATIVATCTEVQAQFFEALEEYGTGGLGVPTSSFDKRLAYEYRVAVGDRMVRFLCFNSAWLSQLHESQGSLYFPSDAVPASQQHDSVVVAMVHHPYNWVEANAARAFRKRLESVADLILTGHEHDASVRLQLVSTGERNLYVEGGALQDSYSPAESVFNAFVLDLENRKQKTARFVWNEDRYTILGVSDNSGDGFGLVWEELQVTRLRDRGEFELMGSMREFLNDPGVNLTHRARGVLGLSDIFILPDLQEVVYPIDKSNRFVRNTQVLDLVTDSPRLLIVGDTQSGKTCLAKTLFRYLEQGGYVSVYVDGTERPPTGDRLHAYLVNLFAKQYLPAQTDAYRQLDRSKRVIVVDDFHRLPLSPSAKRAFIDSLTAFAGKVILFAQDSILTASDLLQPLGRTDSAFAFYRIAQLGHARRADLVDKWLLLDENHDSLNVEFVHRREAITKQLDALIGRNWLPSYPVYILSVLQSAEGATPLDTRISTYGSYYELFIRAALARGRTPVQSDVVLTYLAHFAYRLFKDRLAEVDNGTFGNIHRDFEQLYEIRVPPHSTVEEGR